MCNMNKSLLSGFLVDGCYVVMKDRNVQNSSEALMSLTHLQSLILCTHSSQIDLASLLKLKDTPPVGLMRREGGLLGK